MANPPSRTLVLAATGKTGSRPNNDVQNVTGVPPVSFADFARRTAPAWAQQGVR